MRTIELKHTFKAPRRKVQLFELNKLDIGDKFDYLNTFQGNRDRFSFKNRALNNEIKDVLYNNKNKYRQLFLNKTDVFINHKPTETQLGDWIGVEIECFIPKTDDLNSLDDFKWFFKKHKIAFINLTDDGSLHHDDDSNFISVEFRVLTRINDMSNLEKLCKVLNQELGAEVNKTCGLHVHLDMRDLLNNGKRAVTRVHNLVQCLPLLSSLVPQSRRDNEFCKPGKSSRPSDRYWAINTNSLKKHKTVEVRLHSGTTDFVKISNWIKLLYTITRFKRVKDIVFNLDQFKNYVVNNRINISFLPDCDFLKQRIEKFKVKTEDKDENSSLTSDNGIETSLALNENEYNGVCRVGCECPECSPDAVDEEFDEVI